MTTVFGGNCGFTIAPLTPDDGDYLMRMLARVEGMPLESLQQGVPWDWRSTAEYLDRLDGTLMPNAGFLVGHSALRRVVMGEAATEREHRTSWRRWRLLGEGLAAGGMGFSSTWSSSHNDHTGQPVPSRRHATSWSRSARSCVTTRARRSSSSPQLDSSATRRSGSWPP